MTVFFAAVSLCASLRLTVNPFCSSIETASATVLPVTSGTVIPFFPALTFRAIFVPCATPVPSSTSEEITTPESYLSDSSYVISGIRPRDVSSFCTSSAFFPATAGILTSPSVDTAVLSPVSPDGENSPSFTAATAMMMTPIATAAAIETAVILLSLPGSYPSSSKSSA